MKVFEKRVCILLALAFFLSLSMVFLQKPLSWYDEWSHFGRSIGLANGSFRVTGERENIDVGGYVDEAEQEFLLECVSTPDIGFRTDWTDVFPMQRTGTKVFRSVTNTITNHPLVYLPYILVARLSAWCGIAPVYELLLMRLAGLLCFFGIYVLAMHKAKKAQLPMALFLLSPMCFLTLASVTADAYLLAVSALYLAVLFEKLDRVLAGGPLDRTDCREALLATLLMCFCKLPNFLLIGLWLPVLYLAHRTNTAANRPFICTTALAVLISAVITIGFFLLVKDTNSGAFWDRNVDTAAQLAHIRQNPVHALKTLLYSIAEYTVYFKLQCGYLRNDNLELPLWFGFFFYAGVFRSVRDAKSGSFISGEESRRFRLFDLCAALAIAAFVFLVFLMLYLQFSEIGSIVVEGVQPRYFLPVLLLLLFLQVYHAPKSAACSLRLSLLLCTLPIPFYLLSQLPY